VSRLIIPFPITASKVRALKKSTLKKLMIPISANPPSYENRGISGVNPNGPTPNDGDNPIWPWPPPAQPPTEAAYINYLLSGENGLDTTFASLKAALLAMAGAWGDFPAGAYSIYGATNYWNCYHLGEYATADMSLGRGLAKNTTGSPQPYFIARQQLYFPPTPGWAAPVGGVETLVSITGLTYSEINAGIILPNQVIGLGQDINLPFPNTSFYPVTSRGNSVLCADMYFALIGVAPLMWINQRMGITMLTGAWGEQYVLSTGI
jgi:hypothetical protein